MAMAQPSSSSRRRRRRVNDGSYDAPETGSPDIGADEIQTIAPLGDGSYGTVYKGRCRHMDVAIKILTNQNMDERTREAFRREVSVLSKIYHPNVTLFMGACLEPGNLMIVQELVAGGDLEGKLLSQDDKMTLLKRMEIAKDAALGMNWLHNMNPIIVHRDLKPSNILLTEHLRGKICDFGLSDVMSQGVMRDGATGPKGTPLWMAPEVMLGRPLNEKCDVYSFGILLWQLLTRQEPYPEHEDYESFKHAVCELNERPPIPERSPQRLANLMTICWDAEPQRRPSFEQIIDELDVVIVDIGVQDEVGRFVWLNNFVDRDGVVKWSEFIVVLLKSLYQDAPLYLGGIPTVVSDTEIHNMTSDQLMQYAQQSLQHRDQVNRERNRRDIEGSGPAGVPIDDLTLKYFRAVLAESGTNPNGIAIDGRDDKVRLERFGKVCHWFGPILDPQTRIPRIFDNVRQIVSCEWFHGFVSTPEAEQRLADSAPGTFLVRFSTFRPGFFTISRVSPRNSIEHVRIVHQAGHGYYIGERRYESLLLLIGQERTRQFLEVPAAGSPYRALFQTLRSSGYLAADEDDAYGDYAV